MSETNSWNYCSRTKVLSHNSGLSIHIVNNRGNEITEMNPVIPKGMSSLESIQLIRAGTEYFRKNYHSLKKPVKRFETTLSLKR